ncbi:hypothetical protein SAICODRAFT_25818 [Saitoella complicata NRRL Y-17804]|uniref:uncharacterized protein n=1 Tax=Saitoella complicata (strain BCRC 22490 / CBS 7301 / JCM 7358 / NBRC 10748 / NRRL Y-17804) TaxID=698492 RepID=UPI000867397D|nr:uncharacterized protein SAICODRAFT_25818 [Saitoella complicata NRRL Y-17804]ODQ52516.1 hypothetical protein SAICODRAFT_25818 [Saitoella complicata NRRL Y-17804]
MEDDTRDVELSLTPLTSLAGEKTHTGRDLDDFLVRALAQYGEGSFRKVTAETLAKTAIAPPAERIEDTDDKASDDRRVEAVRANLIGLISKAQNEMSLSLDFLSLLVSMAKPAAAGVTMSPVLKESVQPGGLGTGRIQKAAKGEDLSVCRGWKKKALGDASDALLNAAARLEAKSDTEFGVWHDLLQLKEQGWPLVKLPGGATGRNLGLRFNYRDAGSTYGAKGVGIFTRSSNGTLDFESDITVDARRNSLRVRVLRGNGDVLASRKWQEDREDEAQRNAVEFNIHQAKDYLFEAELFLEILREAKNLAHADIRVSDDTILIPLNNNVELAIDLAARDVEEVAEEARMNGFTEYCHAVLAATHILLDHAHKVQLGRMQAPPTVLQLRATPHQPLVLRPLVAHLRHQTALEALVVEIETIAAALQKASFDARAHVTKRSNIGALAEAQDTMQLVSQLTGSPESKVQVAVASKKLVEITLRTPNSGSSHMYAIEAQWRDNSESVRKATLVTLADVGAFAREVALHNIIDNVLEVGNRQWKKFGEHEIAGRAMSNGEARRIRVVFDDGNFAIRYGTQIMKCLEKPLTDVVREIFS